MKRETEKRALATTDICEYYDRYSYEDYCEWCEINGREPCEEGSTEYYDYLGEMRDDDWDFGTSLLNYALEEDEFIVTGEMGRWYGPKKGYFEGVFMGLWNTIQKCILGWRNSYDDTEIRRGGEYIYIVQRDLWKHGHYCQIARLAAYHLPDLMATIAEGEAKNEQSEKDRIETIQFLNRTFRWDLPTCEESDGRDFAFENIRGFFLRKFDEKAALWDPCNVALFRKVE